jgi:two-component system nitrogen regulation sensor histidine kinase GlnL
MLAHEVKNPLSGIRGAAQLLERVVKGTDQDLARLICGEADRICALLDRMGGFVADGPLERAAVNIHEVLERVQRSAEAGFARHVKFTNDYDPSLPPVYGDRDQLIQVFMNLVKNAAEAVSQRDGAITLRTGFRRGVRLAVPGGEGRVHLPLMVTVSDNGPGMSEEIARHLFDPFITTKSDGAGLGLALVAKLIDDHGGMIEVDTAPGGTDFRVFLPVYTGTDGDQGGN